MPIADLFRKVGTSRSAAKQPQELNRCSDCSDPTESRSEQNEAKSFNDVPTVPTVPTTKSDVQGPKLDAEGLPVEPCPACGCRDFWKPPPIEATTWLCQSCDPVGDQEAWAAYGLADPDWQTPADWRPFEAGEVEHEMDRMWSEANPHGFVELYPDPAQILGRDWRERWGRP